MSELSGIDAARRIAHVCPRTKVLVLTTHLDYAIAAKVMKAGARGLVWKNAASTELKQAIRTVMAGENYLSPQHAEQRNACETCEGGTGFISLTAREREVLRLIAEGGSMKEIAFQLHLSTKTIETHRRQIMEKLKIDNVAGITKYAVRTGLTSL